ncbi:MULTISPECIES: hypothetical protein [Flectobacillus]|uniref:Uncharacterized protein n=1 Tax=Flectobacillus longus TaxID=2984207 RepID=A0ABT6YJ89_9BACT|nr:MULTISPECIES: hypothetical protein [Flectobacillus]MDI9863517.1 hypothetical protein [Flectobacillus longus]MDI9872199.1 hypothetical protein [Flectobacillus roseus]PAC26995.1 hypothetical protein BWI92_24040 [Flectobacillus sp. BAB-3569]
MVSKEAIKSAYRSLARVDRKQIKNTLCDKFGYKERNFQSKISGEICWTNEEIGVLKSLLEIDGA